jgi:hypothetical protein
MLSVSCETRRRWLSWLDASADVSLSRRMPPPKSVFSRRLFETWNDAIYGNPLFTNSNGGPPLLYGRTPTRSVALGLAELVGNSLLAVPQGGRNESKNSTSGATVLT